MINLATKYPDYGFEKHVGYGTKLHREALEKFGPCPEHRRSFRPVREISARFGESAPISAKMGAKDTTSSGQSAEAQIADHLLNLDHQIIERNFKTKLYEIDIISIKDHYIYFTEVKYRKSARHGSALAQITPAKHQQMQLAANYYLQSHPQYHDFQPLLAVGTVTGTPPKVDDWFVLPE